MEGIAQDPDKDSKVIYLFHPDESAESFRLLESMASQFGFQRLEDRDGAATTEHMTEMGRKLAANRAEKF